MNSKRLLWILVAVDVLLAFGSAGAEGFFGWTLPPTLADYARSRASGLGPGGAFRLLLLAICVLCSFTSWTGLVLLWRHARRLYVVSWVIWMLVELISGPSVKPAVAAVFSTASGVVGGAVLGLIYFSDLAHRFERGREAPAAVALSAHR